jgi:ribonucleoside-diphosphate reductase alpha chain
MAGEFRTTFGQDIFNLKYAKFQGETWANRSFEIVEDVCGSRWGKQTPLMSADDRKQLTEYIRTFKFIPGGRYIWYSGRGHSYWNNCFLLKAEADSREEWAALMQRSVSCLMTGGGIGIDYSILRPKGRSLTKTGGTASGPLPLMQMVNEAGRGVMQGGSRRSAIYASLNWQHEDINAFLTAKNWSAVVKEQKEKDFNFPAPLDMTNISVNYDDAALIMFSLKTVSKQ